MKIVHLVLGKANPERANGVNRVAHGLANAQRALGLDVDVWGITPDPAAPTPARTYALRLFARERAPWRLAPKLEHALAELDGTSVVHLHGGYHPEFHRAARVLARRAVPWVLTPHGAYRTAVVRARWVAKRLYLALVDGPLLRDARAVHVFSAVEAEELRGYAPSARAVVLPNGVDTAEFAGPLAARTPGAHPAFAFCGRLDARTKGLDVLLDGFALHLAAGGTGELSVIGDGPDRAALARRARELGLGSRARFHGPLFGAAKLAALRAADVFLHPSRNEGMPIAVLEAGALGLPCLLSRATNLAEPFEAAGAGWTLAPNDARALCTALGRCERLFEAGRLAAHGERARELVARDYDWARIAERSVEALYGAPPAAGRTAA
ncbi:MAG: glycosyltransferase family 4 protein [Planctomycetes bacterium]|nr:glycosyltransferase family 4 protein [Planctomycetota bacterium]